MGHKVSPLCLRLGIHKTWSSRWFAMRRDYVNCLQEDIRVRGFLKRELMQAAVAKIEIERPGEKLRAIIHTARPGVIIGRRGAEIDRLREALHTMTGKEVIIDLREIKNAAIEAQLVAENVAFQLEKRIAFRRAMKRAVQLAMDSGAKGIRILSSGRLAGAEMARKEGYRDGKIPLATLRADIDFGFAEAHTTYGTIGVKTWVYRGDILPPGTDEMQAALAVAAAASSAASAAPGAAA